MSTYLIKGASLLGERVADILIEDGKIARIGQGLEATDAQVVDASGQIALPGLVDIHTHLRQPGYEASETVETGTRAAALGGYTAVFAMANSLPVADTAAVVEQVNRLGKESGWCRVQPIGSVTVGLKGEFLSDIGSMATSEAKVRVFSDDGMCVYDPAIMRRALEYVKTFDGVIAQHAQEPRLTEGAQMNEGKVSADLGLTGWPAVAEEAIIARDVLLAEHLNSRLHICHLSTKGSVEVVRWAKSRGVQVTAEATPHHLILTDEKARTYDPIFKVNPPLRTEEDVLALRQAVADGIIDVIGTDHAPHPAESKECEWACAANGMTGLEQALSIIQMALVEPGHITWADVARIMSETPAKIGSLDAEQGRPLAEGEPANIVLVDPKATRVIKPEEQATKGKNNPYRGMEVPGAVRATFYAGHPTVLNGELASPHRQA
ncbi:dihydroorotase [Rothia dentocariosa]|uniref:dihydroorotase n=1 Tax=Rothia dentocariosa TaxID=2047 RepID=UPI00195ECF31|nr:dihydroorotase [Rothia dentocariosa]VTY11097.1 Dihydroorotase [Rothia dentocariosa]